MARIELAATALVWLVTACGSGLSEQQAVAAAHKKAQPMSSTPVAFKLKVRAACDNLPHVKATPIAKSVPLSSAVDVVTYNTSGAGVADIARL